MGAIATILADLIAGFYTFADAVVALGQAGVTIPATVVSVAGLITYLQTLLGGGGGSVATCVQTKSVKTPGTGTCCAQVPALIAQFGGTLPATVPVYTPGSRNTLIQSGRGVQVTAGQTGECGYCFIVGSKSVKHPGKPRLLFIRGGGTCPSSSSGCCALSAAGGV